MHLLMLGLALVAASKAAGDGNVDPGGRQFFGFDSFNHFAKTEDQSPALTSPVITSRIHFNEVIVSWNADLSSNAYLVVEARVVYPGLTTKYYHLGLWSQDPVRFPPRSEAGQRDAQGDVSTDTLALSQPANRLQIRVTIAGETTTPAAGLKFLGISLANTQTAAEALQPNREAWGKLIPVPERSQMAYPEGKVLCSPTTVSMLMAHWAGALKHPELDRPVPEIVKAIYDAQWHGTGNWTFNMAYAGSFPGIRAYVTRLSDVSELEGWIARSLPVGLSLDYDRLRGKGPGPNGHLVVLVGFTKDGDPIINDPGTTEHVRKTFPRANLVEAWRCSGNTVYLIHPEGASTPEDTFGHWDSPRTRNQSGSAD